METVSDFPPRILRSLSAGAAVGSMSLVSLGMLLTLATQGPAAAAGLSIWGAIEFVFAFVMWFVGLLMFGLGPWVALHRRGFQGWRSAIALGFLTPFFVLCAFKTNLFDLPALLPHRATDFESYSDGGGLVETNYILTPHGWWAALSSSAAFALGGILVGLTIRAVAYRPWRKAKLDSGQAAS